MIRAEYILESIKKVILNERNISNIKEIEDWIKEAEKRTSHPEVRSWLNKTLRSYLINDFTDVVEVTSVKLGSPGWLKKALEQGEPVFEINLRDPAAFEDDVFQAIEVMNNLYPSKDFYKVVKSSVPIVLDKVSDYITNKEKHEGIEEADYKYPDGSRWVKLKTYETIKYEGDLLANCLKTDTLFFVDRIESGKSELWSLRNVKNKPVVHVELSRTRVSDIAGFRNGEVPDEFRDHVFDLLDKLGIKFFDGRSLKQLNAVFFKGKLSRKEDVFTEYERGELLLQACLNNNFAYTEKLLVGGPNPNVSVDGLVPLVEAARGGYIKIVELLLHYKADVSLKDKHGQDPLFAACIFPKQTFDVIDLLVSKYKADVNTFDESGNTPLILCCMHNEVSLAKYLLKHGADLNQLNKYNYSPMWFVLEFRHEEIFDLIVASKDFDLEEYKERILDSVIQFDWVNQLNFLLNRGIDPNFILENGNSLLSHAVYYHHKKIIKLLLDHGADPLSVDKKGQSPLDYAINDTSLYGKDAEIIKMLQK